MKRKTLVFSLVREQSVFMTIVISILTFLSVLAFGIALSVSSGVIRWNNEWNKYATIQITNQNNTERVKKILNENQNKIASVKEISIQEMERMMQPWVSNGTKIKDYLPIMYEIKIKQSDDMKDLKEKMSSLARFLPHTSALQTSISAGWKLVSITLFILALILASIGLCISYISRNIAMLHRHELEILNQVGATDKFIAHQMQIIVTKISSVACLIGFVTALPIIGMILSTAHSARVGLMSTLTLSGGNFIALATLPVLIVIFSVYITKKTTIKILSDPR